MHLYDKLARLFGLSQRPESKTALSEREAFLEQLYAEISMPGALRTRIIAELPCTAAAASVLPDFGDVGFSGVKSINGLIRRQNADTRPDDAVETRYATPAVLRVPA